MNIYNTNKNKIPARKSEASTSPSSLAVSCDSSNGIFLSSNEVTTSPLSSRCSAGSRDSTNSLLSSSSSQLFNNESPSSTSALSRPPMAASCMLKASCSKIPAPPICGPSRKSMTDTSLGSTTLVGRSKIPKPPSADSVNLRTRPESFPETVGLKSTAPPIVIPKLDLGPLMKDEDGVRPAYKVSEAGGNHSHAQPPEEPREQYYLYPRVNAEEERKTLGIISSLPRDKARHLKGIFLSMIEARQSCEAFAFRSDRLLKTMARHWRDQLSVMSSREVVLEEHLSLMKDRCEKQQWLLDSLTKFIEGALGHIGLGAIEDTV